jgi:glycosyltransferase involved in cell wall biosynthesis
MSGSPDVSVVMSVHNGAELLRETVGSILSQEGVRLEFIVVDDGSTDDTLNILSQYAERDARIRIITQENQGLTRALLKGCAAVNGEYIARQDVGDISHPHRLYLQKRALDADTELAFVSCWTEFCGPEREFLYLVKGTGVALSPTYIISETERSGVIDGPTCHPSVMFRKNSYLNAGCYRTEFYCGQDWDLWYRLAELGKFQMIDKPMYTARVMPNSISLDNKVIQEASAKLSRAALRRRSLGLSETETLRRVAAIRPAREKHSASARLRAAGFYFVGQCLRKNGDSRSIDYYRRSVQEYPYLLKPWIRIAQAKLGFDPSRTRP